MFERLRWLLTPKKGKIEQLEMIMKWYKTQSDERGCPMFVYDGSIKGFEDELKGLKGEKG